MQHIITETKVARKDGSTGSRPNPFAAIDVWDDDLYIQEVIKASQLALRKEGQHHLFLTVKGHTGVSGCKVAVRAEPFSARRSDEKTDKSGGKRTRVVMLASHICAKTAADIRQQIKKCFYPSLQPPSGSLSSAPDRGDGFEDVLVVTQKHLEAMLNKHTGSLVHTYYYKKMGELCREGLLICLADPRLVKEFTNEKVMEAITSFFIGPIIAIDYNSNKDFVFKVAAGLLGHDKWLYPWRDAMLSTTEIDNLNSAARTKYLEMRTFMNDYENCKDRLVATDSNGRYYMSRRKACRQLDAFSVVLLQLTGTGIENCCVGTTRESPEAILRRIKQVARGLTIICPNLRVDTVKVGGSDTPQFPLSKKELEALEMQPLELPRLDGRTHSKDDSKGSGGKGGTVSKLKR